MWLAGFSADSLLLDRHWAPAMTRDSVCLAVRVCAVGCNRQKVLDALDAVKTTLDAAGLQCSEIESDTSRQVFTGLRLDYESGILSLEDSRNWRLRHGLEFAASQKQLTGVQVAKSFGHITWSCLLRRPALYSSMLDIVLHGPSDPVAGYGPPSPKSFDGLRHCHRSAIAILSVHGLRGSMLQMPLVEHVVATELRVAGVILKMLRRQEGVQSSGGFRLRNPSVLAAQCWSIVSSLPCGWHAREFSVNVSGSCCLRQNIIHNTSAQVCKQRPVWRCLEETNRDPAGRRQSLCRGVASRVSVY